MANNIQVKDGNGVTVTLKTTESAGVHTPTQNVVGPLTDSQLRASAVPVTGPATDAQMRASPIPVSGPLTDAQLRASAVPVSLSAPITVSVGAAAVLVPISSGTFAVLPGSAGLIAVPVGASGVRIFPNDADVRFRLSGAPAAGVLNALATGGIAKAGVWREQSLPVGAVNVQLLSTEGALANDNTPAYVDVEFFGPAS